MIDRKLQEYADKFGEGFPMFQLGRTRTDDEIVSLIDTCISNGKNAYDMDLVSDDEDEIY